MTGAAVQRQLFISDLDGTLLLSDQSVGPRTREVLGRLLAAGGHFTVATGRSVPSSAATLEGVGLTLPAILHNGALTARLSGGISHLAPLAATTARSLFERALAAGIPPVAYALPAAASSALDTVVLHSHRINAPTQCYLASVSPQHRMVEARDGAPLQQLVPLSLILLADRERLRTFFTVDCADVPGVTWYLGHSAYTPGLGVGEVTAVEASKALAAARLARSLGLGLDRVVAFGDNHNDLPLLEAAGAAYCPEDAPLAIRQRVEGRILAARQEGVACFLERLLEQ